MQSPFFILQEIGDIQNWAEMIEHELLVIEQTMSIVCDEEAMMLDRTTTTTTTATASPDQQVSLAA